VNADEWRQEARRLRYLPGHDSVGVIYWRGWLDRHRSPSITRMSVPPMVVRRMTVKERLEHNEGRPMTKGTQVLRCGRNRYYVIEPDHYADRQARVMRVS
jgi:hypothetical protein